MISNLLLKFYNFPRAINIKLSCRFNRWYFKAKGVKYGKNLNVLGKVHIIGNGNITIGNDFMMTNDGAVNPISSNIQGLFYTEKNSSIEIGNNVGMSSTRLRTSKGISIGNNVKIGACTLLIDTDTHPINYKTRRTSNIGVSSKNIIIEDDVWIGAHCIVLKGVTIGARSIIGAGSVVTKDIPSDCIAAGNPCRIIKYLTE